MAGSRVRPGKTSSGESVLRRWFVGKPKLRLGGGEDTWKVVENSGARSVFKSLIVVFISMFQLVMACTEGL